MAKVTLRIYNREVEGMIESGQLEAAIAHCQYILQTFPMHVETYLLLGKTFLEARRYTDAADIFQRALMSVPDNFVSHVGMSIIRDDEGKLDDAIWHMERAFEVQPSNPAIQGELRRLYGRRDGIEPPKIRLTRDALANMYAQGELFNQAIAEIRSVLAEDDNRPDLQVMLARAYYRAGQKVEAAEMAANLLKKYPYCMDAIRILVDVLPGTARAEDTQVYKERLRMLDPYSSFVTGSAFSSDKVADSAVTLERLEYQAGATPITPQPGWAASLGIQLPAEKEAEPAAGSGAAEPVSDSIAAEPSSDWIAEGASEGQPHVVAPESSASASTSAAEDEVPDWMRSAGWKESHGGAPIEKGDSIVEPPAEPTAQADIPDWLKAMAPHEVTDAVKPDSKPEPENPLPEKEGIPDWMAGLGIATPNIPSEPSQAVLPAENNAFPDWLTGTAGGEESIPATGKTTAAGDTTGGEIPSGELPASILSATEVNEKPQVVEPPVMEQAVPPAPIPAQPVIPPGSLSRMEDDMAFEPSGEARPLNIEDDALAWLESLAVKQGAKEEELLTKPQDRVEEMPESVRQSGGQPSEMATGSLASLLGDEASLESSQPQVEEGGVTSSLPPLEEIAPVEIPAPLSTPAEMPPQPSSLEDVLPSWLKDLKTGHTGQLEMPTTPPAESRETPPSWFEKPAQDLESTGEDSASPKVEQIPSSEDLAEPSKDDITITSWLSKMDVEEALKKARSTTDTGQVPEQVPEQKLEQVSQLIPEQVSQQPLEQAPELTPEKVSDQASQQAPEQVPELAPEQVSEQVSQQASEEMPDWLKRLEKPAPPVETVKNPLAESDLPDWLKKSMPPAGQQPVNLPSSYIGSESELPGLVDEVTPLSEPISPTNPDEWVSTGEKPTPVPQAAPEAPISQVSPPVNNQIQFSRSSGTGMLSRIPGEDKDADLLTKAQSELDANTLSEALHSYTALIKKGRLLDEVIHDLREALYRYPVDIIVWQTLGDAFMRANRLQDALDSYTKAEELLR